MAATDTRPAAGQRALLIYLHGFLSSPQSAKACELRDYLLRHHLPIDFLAPALPDRVEPAYRCAAALIEAHAGRRIGLVGSSLGGFYATALAGRYGLRAVLVNPAVHVAERLATRLGEHQNPYTGVHFTLDESDVKAARALVPTAPRAPQNLRVLLQTGDETLDYRDALAWYAGADIVVEAGGTHRFEGFDQHCPALLNFLELLSDNA